MRASAQRSKNVDGSGAMSLEKVGTEYTSSNFMARLHSSEGVSTRPRVRTCNSNAELAARVNNGSGWDHKARPEGLHHSRRQGGVRRPVLLVRALVFRERVVDVAIKPTLVGLSGGDHRMAA